MVSGNISSGSEKIIKIGFLSDQNSGWMGGVNYFKNLFIAISKVDNPRMIPYINPIKDKKAKFLFEYAKKIKVKKGFKYHFQRILQKFKKQDFDKTKYLEYSPQVDIISHVQAPAHSKYIAWIPDFQHLHLPEMFSEDERNYRSEKFNKLIQQSAKVILSSQDSLNDFKIFAPDYAEKGRVLNFVAIPDLNIYQKTDEIKEQVIKKYDLPQKYFYIPNQFWIHKNHKVVFEAISLLKQQGIEINIVFTGNKSDYRHKDYFDDLMFYVKENNIENNIQLLGLVDHLDVYYFMRNCISILNPSLFEGWSSTVEEAKSLGKNIILSKINVHKEQNPPLGIYFDPHNPHELAEILKEKWENGKSEPDFDLEKEAREKLESRIINFGKKYQEIVFECI